MGDRIKTVLYIILGVISLVTVVWGASEYMHRYVDKQTFAKTCAETKEKFTYLETRQNLMLWQQRSQWLEQQIAYYDQTFGYGCQRCNGNQRQIYMNMKREYDNLLQQIQAVLSRGGG